MFDAILTGVVAGFTVAVIRLLNEDIFVRLNPTIGILISLSLAGFVLVYLLSRQKRRLYPRTSLGDLFVHILTPSDKTAAANWGLRGTISLFLSLCGGLVGAEGAAIEYAQAL